MIYLANYLLNETHFQVIEITRKLATDESFDYDVINKRKQTLLKC